MRASTPTKSLGQQYSDAIRGTKMPPLQLRRVMRWARLNPVRAKALREDLRRERDGRWRVGM